MIQVLQQMVVTLTALVMALSAQVGNFSNTVQSTTQLAAVAPAISGLVGYWKFDEGSGTSVLDSSGNGNGGTINGAVWTTGKASKALYFDGLNDYISINYSISLYPASICAWINYAGDTGMISSIAGNDALSLNVINNPGDQDYIQIFNNQGATDSGSNSISPDTWTHICAVVDTNNNARIYINGVPKSSPVNIGSIIITGNVAIGSVSGGSAQRFKGLIDEVRIYNKALNAQEISSVYKNASF